MSHLHLSREVRAIEREDAFQVAGLGEKIEGLHPAEAEAMGAQQEGGPGAAAGLAGKDS